MLISDLLGTDDVHQFFSDSLVGKEEKCQILIWTAILLLHIQRQKEYLGCSWVLKWVICLWIFASCRFLLDLSKEVNKVFTSNEAQTCSPAKIFLWLNLGISHPTMLLSQSVAGGAMTPAPYFSVLMCWEKKCGEEQLSSAPLASLLSTVEVRVGGAAAFLVGGRGL